MILGKLFESQSAGDFNALKLQRRSSGPNSSRENDKYKCKVLILGSGGR